MNYFLYQSALVSEQVKVYVDGKLIEDVVQKSKAHDKIMYLFEQVKHDVVPWIGKINQFFLIKGSFETKDEMGRTLTFLFASNSNNYKIELNEVAAQTGFQIGSETLSMVDSYSNSNGKKGLTLKCLIIGIILISLLSLLLCNTTPNC